MSCGLQRLRSLANCILVSPSVHPCENSWPTYFSWITPLLQDSGIVFCIKGLFELNCFCIPTLNRRRAMPCQSCYLLSSLDCNALFLSLATATWFTHPIILPFLSWHAIIRITDLALVYKMKRTFIINSIGLATSIVDKCSICQPHGSRSGGWHPSDSTIASTIVSGYANTILTALLSNRLKGIPHIQHIEVMRSPTFFPLMNSWVILTMWSPPLPISVSPLTVLS